MPLTSYPPGQRQSQLAEEELQYMDQYAGGQSVFLDNYDDYEYTGDVLPPEEVKREAEQDEAAGIANHNAASPLAAPAQQPTNPPTDTSSADAFKNVWDEFSAEVKKRTATQYEEKEEFNALHPRMKDPAQLEDFLTWAAGKSHDDDYPQAETMENRTRCRGFLRETRKSYPAEVQMLLEWGCTGGKGKKKSTTKQPGTPHGKKKGPKLR